MQGRSLFAELKRRNVIATLGLYLVGGWLLDGLSKLKSSVFLNRFIKNSAGMYFSHRDGLFTESLWEGSSGQ